jgi:hypothetical protein
VKALATRVQDTTVNLRIRQSPGPIEGDRSHRFDGTITHERVEHIPGVLSSPFAPMSLGKAAELLREDGTVINQKVEGSNASWLLRLE